MRHASERCAVDSVDCIGATCLAVSRDVAHHRTRQRWPPFRLGFCHVLRGHGVLLAKGRDDGFSVDVVICAKVKLSDRPDEPVEMLAKLDRPLLSRQGVQRVLHRVHVLDVQTDLIFDPVAVAQVKDVFH